MAFKDALRGVSENMFLKAIVPDGALGLTKGTRYTKLAFDELHVCLIPFRFSIYEADKIYSNTCPRWLEITKLSRKKKYTISSAISSTPISKILLTQNSPKANLLVCH